MAETDASETAMCPRCGEPMRRERDGVRMPPMPQVFLVLRQYRV